MSITRRSHIFDPFSLNNLCEWDPFHGFPFNRRFIDPSSSFLGLSNTSGFTMASIDWKETPKAHVLKADLPGMKKEEIKVEVEEGNIIQISRERGTGENEEKTDTWHLVERSRGKFMRRLRLPENAKMDEIKAGMENCVLTVTVPREEEEEVKKADHKVKSIEIKEGGEGGGKEGSGCLRIMPRWIKSKKSHKTEC